MMKKAGEILKESRLKKNLTINDVFEGTKIRPSYIESIENSDYKSFQSQTSARGFLKNYANYLGLNSDNIIAVYRREQSDKTNNPNTKLKLKIPMFELSSSLFIIVIAVLLVVFVIGFFTLQYIQVSTPPKFDIIEPADMSTTTQDNVKVVVVAEKGKAIDIQINGKNINSVDQNGNYFYNLELVSGENKIIVVAQNGIKKETVKEIRVFRKDSENIQTTPNPDLNISIRSISNKSFDLTYSIDSGENIKKSFNPGESTQLLAKSKIKIEGPANLNNTIELLINQTKVGLKTDTGKQEISYNDGKILVSPLP
ncbi:MAG: helix-turn-helix domain-containing protein [bacterium]